MLWVTFGHAETTGMTVVVGANVKDENYFAEPKGLLRALVPAARIASGIGGKRGRLASLPVRAATAWNR
jgi:hypothetical protein